MEFSKFLDLISLNLKQNSTTIPQILDPLALSKAIRLTRLPAPYNKLEHNFEKVKKTTFSTLKIVKIYPLRRQKFKYIFCF